MSAEDNLIRDKRALFRSVATDKKEICGMLKENPSLDNVYKAAVYLDCWKEELSKIALINSKLIELIDTDKCPTQDDVYKQEDKITKEYETSLSELKKCTGEIQAMKARLEKQEQLNRSLTNESLNNSLVGGFSSNNSSIKLPDIDVPKFDGNIENFTEWNNMFDAVVNQNPNLLPPQKMYYLKLAMVDGAKYILKDYGIDGSLYEDAYGHLKDRYLNKRKIMESHFRFIFDLPNITWSNVRETLDKYEATVRGIRAVGLDTKKLSPMLAYGLARRLPDRLKQDWENSNSDFSIYPGFESLSKWLNNRCLSIETVNSDKSKERSKSPNQAKKPNKPAATEKTKSSLALVNKPNQTREIPDCVDCGQKHYLAQCSSFLKKSVSDRESFVASKRLCRNCLRKGHFVKQCYASKCKECGENHHTLLHSDSTKNQTPPVNPDNEKSNKESQTKTSMAASQSDIDVLLPTAVVNVRVGKRIVPARVLIDSASQVNLVTESFVNRNHIAKTPSTSNIAGIAPSSVRLNHFVSLTIESRVNKTRIRLDADVIGSLPYNIEPRIIQQIASVLPNLELADNGLQSTSIDILIGAEYASRLTTGQKKFIGDLCLEESQFGWLTVGPFKELKPIDPKCCCLSVTVHDVLQKFWEVEEVIPPKITLHEHELCQNHFEQTYERLSDGRFQVRLPFKSSLEKLSDTYRQAYGALLKYEKAGEPLRSQYIEFMQEYLDLGHMQLADTTKDVQRYYIPHLPVIREDSTTTKFRAVFKASAHTKGKLSLNQVLMNGLIKQPPLFNLLTGFRMYEVAYSADIEKFYRQVYVHPDDRPYQSILWRFDITKPVEIYELNTVTYGTTPAGYETTECLEVIGKKVPPELPEVAKAIRKEIWMDNLLSGEENVEKAITKAKIIHNELLKAKFPLRKYISNSKEFLEAFEPKLRETLQPVSFSSSGAAKILGLQWYPTEDEFRINFKPVNLSNVKLTKRVVSSLIARVYDPLGFANPILIKGKILLQDLWRQGLEWDDPIPEEIKNRFLEYYADLANLFNLHIPRRYASFVIKKFELIGFSDASNKAYGAVVYLKAYNIESKETEVTLVCSKSKVAPLKDIKVPRLELLGTVLLSKLMKVVAEVLEYDISSTFAFCDSTIVLAWLKGPASKYDVFVRNRVDYVTSLIPFNRWNYVNTKENPADLVTRGLTVESLVNNQLWIHGPSWLKNEINCSIKVDLPENPPEVRKSYYSMVACVTANEEIISRFSSLDKLIRVFTLVKTFIVCTRSKDKTATVTYQDAVNDLYKISQLHWFQAEINALKQGDPVHSRSKLASIDPFIDKNGVLRVGGRLRNSTLSYDFKHPIILHSQSNLAKLLVRHVHEKYYHTSQAFTRSFILRRHWIVNGIRSLVRKTIENCVWCTRMNAKPVEQIMGDLPTERTTVSRPFTNSSVDYAGPFTIRCTNHRSPKHLKYYAAFFVCLTTRAVHIEAVADLSTPSFIAAFQRFIARRGFPAVMWSDNGNNFVGAKNEFQLNRAANPIVWKFIPPRSPHQGGIWESAVKSGKKHLLAVTKGAVFTEDEFKTVLTTIESIMNSRPLYQRAATKDLDEIDVLTPGHFLVGSHLLEPCVPEVSPISLSNRLNFQRQIISSFWTKWRQSYLAQLQTRSKWKTQSPNLSIGDIVIVKELCSPCSWPLARIIDGKPDAKGRLRIVTIKTKNNKAVYQRSVQQLVKLPVDTLEDTVPSSSDTA